jgi:hypothetical protein
MWYNWDCLEEKKPIKTASGGEIDALRTTLQTKTEIGLATKPNLTYATFDLSAANFASFDSAINLTSRTVLTHPVHLRPIIHELG